MIEKLANRIASTWKIKNGPVVDLDAIDKLSKELNITVDEVKYILQETTTPGDEIDVPYDYDRIKSAIEAYQEGPM